MSLIHHPFFSSNFLFLELTLFIINTTTCVSSSHTLFGIGEDKILKSRFIQPIYFNYTFGETSSPFVTLSIYNNLNPYKIIRKPIPYGKEEKYRHQTERTLDEVENGCNDTLLYEKTLDLSAFVKEIKQCGFHKKEL